MTLENEHITSTNVVARKLNTEGPFHFTDWGLVPGSLLAEGQDPSDFICERALALLEAKETNLFVRYHSEYHQNVPLTGKAYYREEDIPSWTAIRHLKEGQISPYVLQRTSDIKVKWVPVQSRMAIPESELHYEAKSCYRVIVQS